MRVLIIEGDPVIAANLYDYLEGRGHAIDAAPDGVSGPHLAVTEPFDCILLDLGLPGMGGATLCRRLREQAQVDTPVLVCWTVIVMLFARFMVPTQVAAAMPSR